MNEVPVQLNTGSPRGATSIILQGREAAKVPELWRVRGELFPLFGPKTTQTVVSQHMITKPEVPP